MQLSSDMPQTSAIGMPRPTKNASVSFGIGAAPDTACLTCSSPSFSRSFESTSSSACAHSAATSSGTGSPATSAAAFFAATDRPHCNPIRFVSSGSFAAANSIAALSFSHTRGTAPQIVGRTSGSAPAMARGSETVVIWVPNTSWRYSAPIRSAMWAVGRNDVLRSPNRTPSTSSTANAWNSRLACVISTPLGLPVVPEV